MNDEDQAAPVAAPRRDPGPLALNPVAVAWSGNFAVVMLAAFGFHLTRTQVGAVDTIAAAVVAVVTAVLARPWYIPGVTGAATAVLTAAAAFGLQWTPEQIGIATSALSIVLMLVTHQSVVPVSAGRRGLTATDILLAQMADGRRVRSAGL